MSACLWTSAAFCAMAGFVWGVFTATLLGDQVNLGWLAAVGACLTLQASLAVTGDIALLRKRGVR